MFVHLHVCNLPIAIEWLAPVTRWPLSCASARHLCCLFLGCGVSSRIVSSRLHTGDEISLPAMQPRTRHHHRKTRLRERAR